MFKKTVWSVFAFAVCVAGTNGAFAANDNCNNVVIRLKNATSDEIKITTFQYFDFDKSKWRTESMFGIDGFQKLEPGKSMPWTRDLEHVGADDTKFKVTYQHHIGGTKWGTDRNVTTGTFKCQDGLSKEVSLDQ